MRKKNRIEDIAKKVHEALEEGLRKGLGIAIGIYIFTMNFAFITFFIANASINLGNVCLSLTRKRDVGCLKCLQEGV